MVAAATSCSVATVAELEHGRDEVDDHRSEELVDVVHVRVVDVADEEAEVEGRGEQHEEPEDHLLQVHRRSLARLLRIVRRCAPILPQPRRGGAPVRWSV
jgi:hypothetical protein